MESPKSDVRSHPTGTNGDGKAALTPPAISLPKGGGAIRGIGEKFAANPATGGGSVSIPIPTSPGRSSFAPQLTLSYDSGAGNGPFGLGWSLSLPSITRKTDKGLPRYVDETDGEDADVFILSGAEDLVPSLTFGAGAWKTEPVAPRTLGGSTYAITRFRPRTEGLFARIERWTNRSRPSDTFWRSIGRDNVTTWYGKDERSRVSDPADPARIFSWLICESYDPLGNAIVYSYATEDDRNVDRAQANERNRSRTAGRYLKRIRYGNRTSRLSLPDLTRAEWLFEVVFDYDEGHYLDLAPDAGRPEAAQHPTALAAASIPGPPRWGVRPDPFSVYRSTFEVRTYRRCRRVLMFHNFKELGPEPCLVRSTEFHYRDDQALSFIDAVVQSGFTRDEGQAPLVRDGARLLTYFKKSLPPLEFEYSRAVIQEEIHEVDPQSLENLPAGVDGRLYQFVDLDGEGVSGILSEQAGAWFYKPSAGDGRFGPVEVVARQPATAALSQGTQLLDLAGDGQLDVVAFSGPVPGFYERTTDRDWKSLHTFPSLPQIPWDDPNLRFIDLNGDGHADVLITEDDAFVWYPSIGEEGFLPARRTRQPADEEDGPRLVFADRTQSIYVADMSGDGLGDLVRVQNGGICYWPNLGYGRFGAKTAMDDAPCFDHPDQFDQRRVRLADIDGSGTTDIIYLGADGVRIYFNQAGNRWTSARRVAAFPPVDNVSSIATADLLGNGTACLVWSSPLPNDSGRAMRYVDLMGGQKPHLLVRTINNLGAETHVHYTSSTKFYLEDKANGVPWITRLPFPVHVVDRVETHDYIARNRFVTRYAYHHGYFDGEEREFRGFALVDQWDAEVFASPTGNAPSPFANDDIASDVPPVHTRTWFHTGAYLEGDEVSRFFAGLSARKHRDEYYREPAWRDDDDEARIRFLPDTVLPGDLSLAEEREACRALRGSMLRQEVYGLDGTAKEAHPYTVTEQNHAIVRLQPRVGSRPAVLLTYPLESISYHYERNAADPRITHSLTLEVDDYGQPLKEAAVAYGRRNASADLVLPDDRREQTRSLVTFTENDFTTPIESEADDYRGPLAAESRTFELTGYLPTGDAGRFRAEDFVRSDPADAGGKKRVSRFDAALEYDEPPTGRKERRLIECVRTLYRKNDLTALSPLGSAESRALPGESYKLALTSALVDRIFHRPLDLIPPPGAPRPETLVTNTVAVLGSKTGDGGGYVDLQNDGRWWVPSGQMFYDVDAAATPPVEAATALVHFFVPRRYVDPFGSHSTVLYDDYDLLPRESVDAVGNRITVGVRKADGSIDVSVAGNDYRVLQPRLVTDANRNRTEVAFDILGMVAGSAAKGKDDTVGDTLTGFEANLTRAQIDALYDAVDPAREASALLKGASTRVVYDLDRFRRSRLAVPDDSTRWMPVYACTMARDTHAADPAPPSGPKFQVSFSYSDGFGREIQKKIQAEPGPVVEGGPSVSPRWVGSGWTIFNNKGKPVRQYEPFFSQTAGGGHRFEFGALVGVSPVLFYDPVGRVIATVHPNHTYEKVVFDPWTQRTFDPNDTVAAQGPRETGDPRTDPDIKGYVAQHFKVRPGWTPWLQPRLTGALGTAEQLAATRASAHANTPTTVYADAMGRPFLTVAHNGTSADGSAVLIPTRVRLDIEGNQLEIRDGLEQGGDPRGRLVMRYRYDMLGNRLHQASMEAGERWTLSDVAGKPIRGWDSAGRGYRNEYDPLRRPFRAFVRGADAANPAQELLAEHVLYGDQHPDGERQNTRAKPWLHLDQAGVVINNAYDFKGNLLSSTRRLARTFKQQVDWSAANVGLALDGSRNINPVTVDAALAPLLEADSFVARTSYDALNRAVQVLPPRASSGRTNVIQPVFNEANLLERVDVWLDVAEPAGLLDRAVTAPAPVGVEDVAYNAKGQRLLIQYNNGAQTRYSYDPDTFRLRHLYTRRGSAFATDCDNPAPPPSTIAAPATPPPGKACGLQNLHYTYDPVGNVIAIRDGAHPAIYFRNSRIDPAADYTYDALYRLIAATGREHLGLLGGTPVPHSHDDARRIGVDLSASDRTAMGIYVEEFVYDAVGNFQSVTHRGTDPAHPGWTRGYRYDEPSQIEAGTRSNRLSETVLGGAAAVPERYLHDAHGNTVRMPHFAAPADPTAGNMHWDFKDQLRRVDFGGGGTVWYAYDAAGQRARKVWEKSPGLTEERIYLGGFEVFRSRGASGAVTLERETLHVMDDTQRIAIVETRTVGADAAPRELIRYQFGNHLGSACLELDEGAQIISYEEYSAYGSTTFQAVRSQTETPKRYRYTGKERDEESGLYYHGARYYAPWLGRWVSCDPAELADGPNRYAYARQSPVVLIDPNGRDSRRPGLSVSPQSKLSAQQIVDMIGRSQKLEPWMKGVFYAKGNRVMVKERFALPSNVTQQQIPKWFTGAMRAIQSGDWHFTTGASIASSESRRPNEKLAGDHEPGDAPVAGPSTTGMMTGETIESHPGGARMGLRKMLDENAGGDTNPAARRAATDTKGAQGLIVVANRFRSSADPTKEATRSDDAILETMFHELAAHANQISQKLSSDHGREDYVTAPMTDADFIAKDVHTFFAPPSESSLIRTVGGNKANTADKANLWERAKGSAGKREGNSWDRIRQSPASP